MLCTANGRIDVAVPGKLQVYDRLTGRECWTCKSLLRTIMATAVVQDDLT